MKRITSPFISLALVLSSATAIAQSVVVVPRFSVDETLTDNATLVHAGSRSDQITELSPGVRVNIQGARLKTYFDYSLSHLIYAQGTSGNRNQNNLDTFGTLEAVDGKLFLDFSGNISHQAISAFGTQSSGNLTFNSNRTEVSTYRISPYFRSKIGNIVNIDGRLSRGIRTSTNDAASNSATTDMDVGISSAESFRSLGWVARASRQQVDFSSGRPTEADHIRVGLTYALTPQVKFFADSGREANNYAALEKQTYSTNTVGMDWQPSQRTTVAVLRGNRSFGANHNVSLEHRTARTVWKFSDGKDVLTVPAQNEFGLIGNVYDLFDRQLMSAVPDSQTRAALVSQYLQSNHIDPNSPVLGNFLSSAVSLQRRQDLSFALLGVRDTLTFLFSRTVTNRLDAVSSSLDNLTTAKYVTQRGYSINYSHRLTPEYALTAQWSMQDNTGDLASQANTLKSIGLSIAGKISPRTSTGLGFRHVVADSLLNPYSENALTGHLSVQF